MSGGTTQAATTRALLACRIVCGPLYVAATMAQALTRDGFDILQHRFTLLTTGELGWIHQANMIVVGVLTLLFAAGVSRTLRSGGGAVWVPRLLALFGLAYVVGGVLTADPVLGFPPGTTQEMVQASWSGIVQNASRGVSSFFLIAASLAVARWFVAEGLRGLALLYVTAIPVVFAALFAAGLPIGFKSGGLAYLMTPWIWVTILALHLTSRDAKRVAGTAPLGSH